MKHEDTKPTVLLALEKKFRFYATYISFGMVPLVLLRFVAIPSNQELYLRICDMILMISLVAFLGTISAMSSYRDLINLLSLGAPAPMMLFLKITDEISYDKFSTYPVTTFRADLYPVDAKQSGAPAITMIVNTNALAIFSDLEKRKQPTAVLVYGAHTRGPVLVKAGNEGWLWATRTSAIKRSPSGQLKAGDSSHNTQR